MQPWIEQLQKQEVLLFLEADAPELKNGSAILETLACLPIYKVVTLGEMAFAVAAWRRAGREVQVCDVAAGAPRAAPGCVTWLALPSEATSEPPWVAPLLRTWFASHAVWFWVRDLGSPGFKQRYLEMAQTVGPHRSCYRAVLPQPPEPLLARYWEAHNVVLEITALHLWAQQLARAWVDSAATKQGEDATLSDNARPYRFLASYTEADAAAFFGRAGDIRALGELVLAESLTLCFGPSGVGKTSLLQAGLMPRLRRQGCLPLYCRPGSDPIPALDAAAQQAYAALRLAPPPAAAHSPAAERLASLLAGLAQQTRRTLVIIFDQFEELFTLLGTETATQLAETLAHLLRLPETPLHIVLALREDFLAPLHTLQAHLPAILAHRYRLHPLSPAAARAAIAEPARQCGLTYEPALIEQLLSDLADDAGTIEPADLQIVCDTLYDDVIARGEQTFTLARYQDLGGAAQLLGHYLERVVAAQPEAAAAQAVLKALVTAQGTKAALPAAEIARLAAVPEESVTALLQHLDRPHRLVRPLQQEGAPRYELMHEVLGPRILAWIADPAEREAKALHDLLRVERHNWERFGALPGAGKVRALDAQRANPHLRLSAGDIELIVRGAVLHAVDPAFWLARAAEAGIPAGDFLLPALLSPQAEVRRRAADLLGARRALRELRARLRAGAQETRAQAAQALGEFSHPRAFRLLRRARHAAEESVRLAVWLALESHDARATARLRQQDACLPLLIAGALVYALLLLRTLLGASFAISDLPTIIQSLFSAIPNVVRNLPLSTTLLAVLWLLSAVSIYWLLPRLPARLLAWPGALLAAGGSLARWGWFKGGTLALWLWAFSGDARRAPHLALAAGLPFLPLLLTGAAASEVLWVVAGVLLLLTALAALPARWGRYGADRPAAVALLGGAVGGAGGALLAGANPVPTLLMGLLAAWGRRWARKPPIYSKRIQKVTKEGDWLFFFDLAIALWDLLDQFSFQFKPLVGGVVGAAWATALLRAAAGLPGGGASPWGWGDALVLGVALGLGLWWGAKSLRRALLWPALCGAAGGFLVQGASGALMGACLGLGLGLGEWLAAKIAPTRAQPLGK
jgi:hypothetical protein